MQRKKQVLIGVLLAISLMILILDSKTSLKGAKDGISLCISVVIPSLFPFIFLTTMLPSRLLGYRVKGIGGLCRLCGIPDGAESLFLLSFIGGYPLGARMVADAHRQGCISRATACRMLGFCSNAGPAFIFGMVGSLFRDRKVVWVIWFIHIVSAILVGIILPNKTNEACMLKPQKSITVPQALEISLSAMINICGWVVIFRVILAFLERWLLWLMPPETRSSIFGLLELSNGIASLHQVQSERIRMILCSGMLSFGGLCVLMQTISVTQDLAIGFYFPGKVLQCLLSILFSIILQYPLFSSEAQINLPSLLYIVLVSCICILTFFLSKKSSSISETNNV